jgi:hypothetical protein
MNQDIIDILETGDRIDNYVKEVEQAEKEIGWKEDKLYNKDGVIILQKANIKSKKEHIEKINE